MDTIKNITPLQWLIILLSVNSAVAGATAQLTDLFGAHIAHLIVSSVTFANTIIGAFMVPFTGQSAMVKNVLAMPGVQKLEVNENANATLAQIAVDRNVDKISPTAAAQSKVEQIARVGALLIAVILPFLLFSPVQAQGLPHARSAAPLTGDPVKDIKAAIDQKNAAVAAANPSGPNSPDVSCDFKIFLGLTPQNLESAIKKCLSDVNSTLVDDTQRALDSAKAYTQTGATSPTPDNDAINCLTPGLAILKAGVIVPAVAEVKDASGNITTPAVPARVPGLILLFQKYREFVLAGGLTSCKTWVDTAVNATATQAINNAAGIATAGAIGALLVPK